MQTAAGLTNVEVTGAPPLSTNVTPTWDATVTIYVAPVCSTKAGWEGADTALGVSLLCSFAESIPTQNCDQPNNKKQCVVNKEGHRAQDHGQE